MLDFGMSRFFLALTLLFTLVGCSGFIKSTPYMQGSFVGYYLTEPATTPVGVRLDLKAGEVTTTRYIFTGTAVLGAEHYTVEGSELTNMNLEFLTPQALPPLSDMMMTLKD